MLIIKSVVAKSRDLDKRYLCLHKNWGVQGIKKPLSFILRFIGVLCDQILILFSTFIQFKLAIPKSKRVALDQSREFSNPQALIW